MTNTKEALLAHVMREVSNIGMIPAEVSAVATATCGLAALSTMNAPIPLSLIEEWRGYINQVEAVRRPPTPQDKVLRLYEDGMPT